MKPTPSLTRRISCAALLCTLSLLPLGGFAQQQVLKHDFADADRSAWFTSGKNHLLKAHAENGGSMTQQIGNTTSQFLIYFTPSGAAQELAVGAQLKLTLQFSVDTPGATPNSWIRLGLFDSEAFRIARNGKGVAAQEFANYRGYGMFGTLAGGWKIIAKRTGEANGLLVTGTPWEHLQSNREGAVFDITDNTPYTFVMTIHRNAEQSVQIDVSCTGNGQTARYSATDSQNPFLSFDTFALVANAGFARAITVSDVQIDYTK